jgi:hypothetical protein
MDARHLARDLQHLWELAQSIRLSATELQEAIPSRDPFRRLALEIALHDLQSFAARAAALATLAEALPTRRKKP